MTRIARRTLSLSAFAAPLSATASRAQPAPPVRMVLDWAPQPQQSPWFLAADRGQQSIMTLRGRGIGRLQDLAGRRIGRTAGDIIGPLWPAFSRLHGIGSPLIEWVAVTPQLRDSLVWRGQVDAASGFASTSYFNLLALGARPEDVLLFPFAEHGFDLFGNGLVVRADYAERDGDLLRRFIRATIAGLRDALADRAAAVAAVTRRDPTATAAVEGGALRLHPPALGPDRRCPPPRHRGGAVRAAGPRHRLPGRGLRHPRAVARKLFRARIPAAGGGAGDRSMTAPQRARARGRAPR